MRLQAEARIAKEALPLVNATEATEGEFPAYATRRLQTKVRQNTRSSQIGEHKETRYNANMAFGIRICGQRQR
ncbi:MAG: hypothetical protein WDM76_07725 [Limisphaerales bacterium]